VVGFGCPYNEFACYRQCVGAGKHHGFCGKNGRLPMRRR
ncbi:hypothetical protein MTO96_036147, partial [Rhipicephalus appendiculatus]